MTTTKANPRPFRPDWALPPGRILAETIGELGIDQAELARRMAVSAKQVSELIHAKTVLTPETAIRLDAATGVPASFWSNIESRYREHEARKGIAAEMAKHTEWAKKFPIKFLRDCGVISSNAKGAGLVAELCAFFRVATPDAWHTQYTKAEVSFRRSARFNCALEATASWLCVARHRAEQIETEPFSRDEFARAVTDARALSRLSPEVYGTKLVERCAKAGVAVVYVELPPKCPASGAAQWLRDDKAMIVLSVRHGSDDHFWFSFFHEAGHVLAVDRKVVYLDGKSGTETDVAEQTANQFAQDTLIPPARRDEMRSLRTSAEVVAFARRIGIAPGIVVGQLQHEGLLDWHQMHPLKVRLTLKAS